MKVKWDAEGVDKASGEWIRITNGGSTPVSLKHWSVRDAHLRGDKHMPGYKFPPNAVIPAKDSIRVVVGKGREHGQDVLLGSPGERDDLRERHPRQEEGRRRRVPVRS